MFLRTFSELILSGKTNTWNGKETGLRFIDFTSQHYLSSNISSLSIPFVASCAIITVSSSKLFIGRVESGWVARPGRWRIKFFRQRLTNERRGWCTSSFSLFQAPPCYQRSPLVVGERRREVIHLCLSKFTDVEVEARFKFARSGIGRVVKHNFAASSFSLRNSN